LDLEVEQQTHLKPPWFEGRNWRESASKVAEFFALLILVSICGQAPGPAVMCNKDEKEIKTKTVECLHCLTTIHSLDR
jgi:hypothetical protein